MGQEYFVKFGAHKILKIIFNMWISLKNMQRCNLFFCMSLDSRFWHKVYHRGTGLNTMTVTILEAHYSRLKNIYILH